MLDYARQRAAQAMQSARCAVLVTHGPAGVVATQAPCCAVGLVVCLWVPRTSDHLYNLEHDPGVTLLADGWSLTGWARVSTAGEDGASPDGGEPGADRWLVEIRVEPARMQIYTSGAWEAAETIDLCASGRTMESNPDRDPAERQTGSVNSSED